MPGQVVGGMYSKIFDTGNHLHSYSFDVEGIGGFLLLNVVNVTLVIFDCIPILSINVTCRVQVSGCHFLKTN